MRLKVRKRSTTLAALASTFMLSGPNVTIAGSQTQCILVDEVQVQTEPPESLDEIEETLWRMDQGHRLVSGTSRFLVIRRYESEDRIADAQIFTKITAPLPSKDPPLVGSTLLKQGQYSKGNAGYAHRREVWQAQRLDLVLTPGSEGVSTIAIRGKILALHALRKSSQTFDVDIRCQLVTRQFDELTSWQGGLGEGWQYFYPQMLNMSQRDMPW